MLPLKDDNPTARTPVLTWLLIAVNTVVFAVQLFAPPVTSENMVRIFALVPLHFSDGSLAWGVFTLFSSQFLHGSVAHLGGNMLYLWIFGNNIEDHLGRVRFLPFYLGCGAAAGLAHVLSGPSSTVPTIGASGAIAGILGAYVALFPRARIHTLILLPLFIQIVKVSAMVWLGFWFVLQIAFAVLSDVSGGGVAWYAHAGGFAFGFLAIRAFRSRPRRRVSYPEFEGRTWAG